jgi:hypothetical protein
MKSLEAVNILILGTFMVLASMNMILQFTLGRGLVLAGAGGGSLTRTAVRVSKKLDFRSDNERILRAYQECGLL